MSIENYALEGLSSFSALSEDKTVPLAQRIESQSKEGSGGAGPEFEQFYTAFMKWISEVMPPPSGGIQQYLKQYVTTGGEQTYKTTQKQMDVLTQVAARMKEQGLEDDAVYKEIKTALVSVSMSNMFIQEFMQEVFMPSNNNDDEDDRANTNW